MIFVNCTREKQKEHHPYPNINFALIVPQYQQLPRSMMNFPKQSELNLDFYIVSFSETLIYLLPEHSTVSKSQKLIFIHLYSLKTFFIAFNLTSFQFYQQNGKNFLYPMKVGFKNNNSKITALPSTLLKYKSINLNQLKTLSVKRLTNWKDPPSSPSWKLQKTRTSKMKDFSTRLSLERNIF